MSLNVTYDQCYYGIVKMRDETEARIPLLHIPSFLPVLQQRGGKYGRMAKADAGCIVWPAVPGAETGRRAGANPASSTTVRKDG